MAEPFESKPLYGGELGGEQQQEGYPPSAPPPCSLPPYTDPYATDPYSQNAFGNPSEPIQPPHPVMPSTTSPPPDMNTHFIPQEPQQPQTPTHHQKRQTPIRNVHRNPFPPGPQRVNQTIDGQRLYHRSTEITCPHCHSAVTTTVEHEPGLATWGVCIGAVFFGFWCGCCLIPFCVNELKDSYHYCPLCDRQVGAFQVFH